MLQLHVKWQGNKNQTHIWTDLNLQRSESIPQIKYFIYPINRYNTLNIKIVEWQQRTRSKKKTFPFFFNSVKSQVCLFTITCTAFHVMYRSTPKCYTSSAIIMEMLSRSLSNFCRWVFVVVVAVLRLFYAKFFFHYTSTVVCVQCIRIHTRCLLHAHTYRTPRIEQHDFHTNITIHKVSCLFKHLNLKCAQKGYTEKLTHVHQFFSFCICNMEKHLFLFALK